MQLWFNLVVLHACRCFYCLQDTPHSSELALPVAVAHSAFSTLPKILCAAACVCKD